MSDKTKKWIKATGVRVVKTAAEAALGVVISATVIGDVDWNLVGGTVALASFICFCTCIKGLPEVQ